MKTKIGIPLGLALVMFIGVFTAMLALGVMAPSDAMAQAEDEGDFAVTLSNFNPYQGTGISFKVESNAAVSPQMVDDPDTTELETVDDGTMVTITFLNDFSASAAGDADDWKLGGKTVQAASASSTTVTLMAGPDMKPVASGDDLSVSYTGSGIVNPDSSSGHTIGVEIGGGATLTSKAFDIDTSRVGDVSVTNSPSSPGSQAQYQITFYTGPILNEGTGQILLEIDSSVGVPTSLSTQDVRISASLVGGGTDTNPSSPNQSRPLDLAPTYQVLPGTDNRKLYTIAVPDMDAAEGRNANIAAGAMVTLTLLANSGFTNPTEAGTDDFTVSTNASTTGVKATFTTMVQLFSDDKADNRNKPLTITGKGFKNGTSATVYLDRNKNGMKDTGDVDLISVPVASDDTFEATFTVTVPPFEPGEGNMINAVDGETPPNTSATAVAFEVEGLLTVSPATLGVGDTLSIDLKDWLDQQITKVEIGGVDHTPLTRQTVANNRLQFDIEIGDSVRLGTQQVKVFTDGENDTTNILISGADLVITPTMVVPNQTIAVTGRGFHNNATINMDRDNSVVSLDGADIKVRGGGSSRKALTTAKKWTLTTEAIGPLP